MSLYNRGGTSMIVGRIGKLQCVRQVVLLPGERLSMKVKGHFKLAALKQQITGVKLDARIDAFASPIRHYDPNWTTYVQEGVTGASTIPTIATWNANFPETSTIGVGRITHDFMKFYAQHVVNIWNEWYRWREDARVSVDSPPLDFFANFGKECVNLESAMTRLHAVPDIHTDEQNVPSATVLNVKDLARIQSRYAQAASTDWKADGKYNEFMQEVWGPKARGSNEVDKVPIRLRGGAKLSVQSSQIYATDGASLGEAATFSNFDVDNTWNDFIATEHMVVAVVVVLRFSPISDSAPALFLYPDDFSKALAIGDAYQIANLPPIAVKARQLENDPGSGVIGYLPSGFEWREGYNHIGHKILQLNSFPLLDDQILTAAGLRDASKISNCFVSTELEHYYGDMLFQCNVDSQIRPAGMSIMAGSGKGLGTSANHPTNRTLIA